MSNMFDTYNNQPEWYIPDNRPRLCKPHDLVIVVGETTLHTFDVPHFNIDQYCKNVEIIYKVGLTCVLIKDKNNAQITTDDFGASIVTVTLSPLETKYFKSTLLDTNVQLKFHLVDDSIQYSQIYKIKVLDSLDTNKITPVPPTPPQPGTLGGLGYTED